MSNPCFVVIPHAGASAATMKSLVENLSNILPTVTLELPGRGRRWRESLLYTADEAIQDLANQMKNIKFPILIGYSLGAYLAIGVVHFTPVTTPFIVAISNAPLYKHSYFLEKNALNLSEIEILNIARSFGSISPKILEDEIMRERAISILRADFAVSDSFLRQHHKIKVDCDIAAIYGIEDYISSIEADKWKLSTSRELTLFNVPGGHFSVLKHPQLIYKFVEELLLIKTKGR